MLLYTQVWWQLALPVQPYKTTFDNNRPIIVYTGEYSSAQIAVVYTIADIGCVQLEASISPKAMMQDPNFTSFLSTSFSTKSELTLHNITFPNCRKNVHEFRSRYFIHDAGCITVYIEWTPLAVYSASI